MNLIAFLVRNKVHFEFMEKRTTHHALEASQASGMALNEIVKTLVFIAQDAIPDINKHAPLRTGLGVYRFAFSQPRTALYPAVVNFCSPWLVNRLVERARKLNIPLNITADTTSFSDDCIAYEVNPEVQSTLLYIARRYSHSPHEVVDLNNAERAVSLLCEVITDSDRWD